MASPRFELRVLSARISADSRSLLLNTVPIPEASAYAITLPAISSPNAGKPARTDLPQHRAVDVGFDCCGVYATWRPAAAGQEDWTGWLPHLDLAVARALTKGSSEHDLALGGDQAAG